MKKKQPNHGSDPIGNLCLQCGLCCNGVIFADVRLVSSDDAEKLRSLGLALRPMRGRKTSADSAGPVLKLCQPCGMFINGTCQIYSDRPHHCRHFECLLLKQVLAGKTSQQAALGKIRRTLRLVKRVEDLLDQLGDNDVGVPLRKRFKRTAARLAEQAEDPSVAELYGQLTLAMHDLNLVLSEFFYRG